MTPGARLQAAIDVLDRIDGENASADDCLRAYFRPRRYAGSKDRRAVRETVYGILRRRARLDWWLAGAGGVLEPDNRARVLADLALSGTEPATLFGQGEHAPAPLSSAEADIAANLAGQSIDHPAQAAVTRLELPHWLDGSLRRAWGDAFEAEAAALAEPGPVDLRVNISRVSREQAAKALGKAGIATAPTPLSPVGLRLAERADVTRTEAFRKGLIEVQDEGSQLIALLSGARPGHAVCDYCAGAGGKTLALADMMGLQGGTTAGRLVACDTEPRRLGRMTERLARAKLVDTVERHVLSAPDPWAGDNADAFDVVFIDAPCSGSGTWRRHPEAKWRLGPDRLAALSTLQDEILDAASALVRPGGRLLYATCSVLPEENEDRARAFTARHAAFAPLPAPEVWASALKTPCPVPGETLRLGPAATGTDGFFCAVWQKNEGAV
jgi:16S rRNA (cytosine967-C5)-methyltransferase